MTKVLHRIKAFLYPNLLTDNPNDLSARVSSERTLRVKDVCFTAVSRGGASTTTEAMEHNVNLFLKEMAYQLSDGYSINTGYFTASVQIRGIFESSTETFNPDKHSVLFQFCQGDLLRKELSLIDIRILGMAENGSLISQVIDVKTGSVNELLTPGRNLTIKGQKLKLLGDHDMVGVYFINTDTEERIRVEDEDVVKNNPSELIIIIPDLSIGSYQLEIVTQYSGSTLLKEPRVCQSDRVLTVV